LSCFAHSNGSAVDFSSVHVLQGIIGIAFIFEGYETEATLTSSLTIFRNQNIRNFAIFREGVSHVSFARSEANVANVELALFNISFSW
jgi:hypothetical protein